MKRLGIFKGLAPQAPDALERADRWRELAECATPGYDLEIWQPVGSGPTAQEQTDEAKAVCRRCPVIDACLSWSLEHREDTGIWGGLDEDERRRMHRRKTRTPAVNPRGRSLAEVLAERSTPLTDGHTGWSGTTPVTIKGACYTPAQLAWHVAYGGPPEGRVTTDCGHVGCITAGHLLDDQGRLNRHGTPAAYKAHERRGEAPCERCKAARRAADQDRRTKTAA